MLAVKVFCGAGIGGMAAARQKVRGAGADLWKMRKLAGVAAPTSCPRNLAWTRSIAGQRWLRKNRLAWGQGAMGGRSCARHTQESLGERSAAASAVDPAATCAWLRGCPTANDALHVRGCLCLPTTPCA